MKFKRFFTNDNSDAYQGIEFKTTSSEIKNPDGTIVFSIKTQKALRKLLGKTIETLSTETAQDQANDLLYALR